MTSPADANHALEREARRLYRRYATEVIERFELCPWAARARAEGHVQELVFPSEIHFEPARLLAPMAALESAPETEVALLILPRLAVAPLQFERDVAELQRRYAARHEHGSTPFALAAFHPEADPDPSDAERLIAFLRRSPDPTIQLIRVTSLERVRARRPDGTQFLDVRLMTPEALASREHTGLRRHIAEQNLATVQRAGIEQLEAIFADIARDRAESYARLGAALARR